MTQRIPMSRKSTNVSIDDSSIDRDTDSPKWSSVRPVRSRAQILAAVNLLSSSGRINAQNLATELAAQRASDEDNRLHALGVSSLRFGRAIKGQRYLTYTKQMIRLLKYDGLVEVQHDLVIPTDDCLIMGKMLKTDPIKAEEFFLEKTVNSEFKSYSRYLRALYDFNGLQIPQTYSKRDASLSAFIASLGVPLNVVSFYSLRDFYYDFDLLNYFIDDEGERIVPLYWLNRLPNELYQASFKSPVGWVSYRRKLSDSRFAQALADTYFGMTGGTSRVVELIRLREKVSEHHKIGERQFNDLFNRAITNSKELSIRPSIGDLTFRTRTGMKTKVLSLPTSERGYPYTLVRISRREH